jgi:GTP cyclohydrolase II
MIQDFRCSTNAPGKEGHPRMSAAHSSANSALLGNKECLNVSRALSELQARRPIRIRAYGESLLALPVDGLDGQRLGDFAVLCSPNSPKLVVTQQRARSIGIRASTAMIAFPSSRREHYLRPRCQC